MENLEGKFQIFGNIDVVVYDEKTGDIKDTRHIKNKVLTSGSQYIANRMMDATYGVMSHMLVGSTGTAATVSDVWTNSSTAGAIGSTNGITGNNYTTVGTPVIGTSGPSYTIQYQATFAAGVATGTLQEAAIANSITFPHTGTSKTLSRATFNPVSKSSTDAMAITWTITVVVS